MSYHVRLLLILAVTFGLALSAQAQDDYSGSITVNSGVTLDGAGVVKVGTGTQTLGGVNTYTDLTVLSTGALYVNNSGALSYGGTINLSAGMLTLNNYSGATLVNTGANLTLNLTVNQVGTAYIPLTLNPGDPAQLTPSSVATYLNLIGGNFSGTASVVLTLNTITATPVVYLDSGSLEAVAVPEPSTIVLTLLAATSFFVLRRHALLA